MSAAGSNPASSALVPTVGASRAHGSKEGRALDDVMRFRWSRAYGLRFAGLAVILLGVCWLVAALAGFPPWSLVLLGVVAAVTVVCAVRLVAVPPVLLEISSHGYRVRNV